MESDISTLLTVCDYKYIENFENLVLSYIINQNNKNLLNLNHFFIYKKEGEIKKFKNRFSFLNKYKNIKIIFVPFNKKKYKYEDRFFSCHYRFTAIQNLIQDEKYNKIIYLDVDSLINKSIDLNEIDNYSVYFGLRYNIKKNKNIFENNNINTDNLKIISNVCKIKSRILSGVIILKNNQESKEIINNIIIKYKYLYDNNKLLWFSDQNILDEIFFSKKYKIGTVPLKFFDLRLNNENYIHLSKGVEFPTTRDAWISVCKKNKKFFFENNN